MKILFIEWESYGKEDIKAAMLAEGHELICFPFEYSASCSVKQFISDPETEERLRSMLHREVPDVTFSTDYFPVISTVCQKEGIRYISWNYDCPYLFLYSTTIVNPCNVIYVFDKEMYMEYRRAGVSTVHYLPLAADVERLDALDKNIEQGSFLYDISFVGSLYLEKGDRFGQIEPRLPDYAKGYLKALVAVQLKIQEYDFIPELLRPILDDLYKAYPVERRIAGMEPEGFFYEHTMIKRRITAIERIELLEAAARAYGVDLFTHTKEFSMPGMQNHGGVGYYQEMPLTFKQSKVNLNITLRSIKSGIPLRAFDIMGAGGFLLSNYQSGFLEHFIPGVDLEFYHSKEDMLKKIDHYLRHEEERKAIAKNGHDKVAAEHTYRHRVREMLDF